MMRLALFEIVDLFAEQVVSFFEGLKDVAIVKLIFVRLLRLQEVKDTHHFPRLPISERSANDWVFATRRLALPQSLIRLTF